MLIAAFCFLAGCAKPEQPMVEEPPTPQAVQQPQPEVEQPKPEGLAKLPPPQRAEVKDKVNQIFRGAVLIDEARNPYFFVGDFNGDLSQDIAVIVKPAEGKLREINDEFPAWIRNDALEGVLPESVVKTASSVAGPRPVRMEMSDLLLAVVHGYGATGWRANEAQQTHLVRNAIGSDMTAGPWKDVLAKKNREQQLPRFHGDVIHATLAGVTGFLYYNGAHYTRYDPRHSRPEPPKRLVHSRAR